MLYYWLKYLMQFALTIFYRKRIFTGWDKIPATGPVIFACNHPNSFLDAMIIGAFIKRETYFLARSDVFNSPLKLWILSQFKLMPIYRLSEGKEDLGKNQDTFQKCHDIFRKGGAVLMFSEGLCIQEMRLRPLKKGTARIAMEYSKNGAPLMIIPTGLNYLKPMNFREDLMIQMDTPFNAADFAAEYNENQAKGIQSFNNKLKDGLENSVIDIREKKNEKAIEQLVEIEYNNGGDLKKLIDIVKPAYSDEAIKALEDYRNNLKVRDEVVAGKKTNVLLAIPATLIFGIAFWLYMIPIAPALNLVAKKIKLVEFKDSVLIGASVVFTFLYWLIIFFVIGPTIGWNIAAATILFMILIALLAGPSFDVIRTVREQSRVTPDLQKIRASVLHLVQSH